MVETQKPVRRVLEGRIVSTKMQNTIVVRVERAYMDEELRKVVRTARKYKVHHDGQQQLKEGDVVEIYEGRPVSKTKYMYLHKVISGR